MHAHADHQISHLVATVKAGALRCPAQASRHRTLMGERWRQLVIGVVLMIGYPRSWAILAKDPELADFLLDGESPPQTGSGDQRMANYKTLSANEEFVGLLSKTNLKAEDLSGSDAETRIDADVVRWLTRIIPIAG